MNKQKVIMHMEQMAPLIIDAVSNGKNFLLCPKGTSMLPTIRPEKDYVLLSSPDKISKYDLILFKRNNGKFALHRIVKCCKNNTYTLCGDNQISFERGITKSQIIAKVTAIHKNGGDKIIDTTTKANFIYAILIRTFRFPKRCIVLIGRKILKTLKKSKHYGACS